MGLRDVFEDATHYYIVMDLVSGGEMFDHLEKFGAFREADAARLTREVASALAFLHRIGVVHADLKPENLMLCSKIRCDGTIKVIDFGCAVVGHGVGEEDLVSSVTQRDDPPLSSKQKRDKTPSVISTGTPAYWPPERLEKGVAANAAMDMWSVGVILYMMLTCMHPFDEHGCSTDTDIEKRILSDPSPPLGPGYTDHLSESVVDLMRKLMHKDPNLRMTADEVLQHPWVRGETAAKTTDYSAYSRTKLSKFSSDTMSL